MRSPIARAGIIGAVLAVATLILIVLTIRSSIGHACEVCIEYRGRTACRQAAGTSREEALRTATDNACAFLAQGMTASLECMRVPPLSQTCDGGPP